MKHLQIIAWVFGILGSVATVCLFISRFSGPKGKRLDAVIMSRASLLNPAAKTGVDTLRLTLGGRDLGNPQVMQVRFKNVGAEPIRSSDIEEPIQLKVQGQGSVVSANVIAAFPGDLSPLPQLLPGNGLRFGRCLLNPGDSFVASIIYVPQQWETLAAQVPLEVSGRIAGIGSIPIREPSQSQSGHPVPDAVVMLILVITMSFTLSTLLSLLFANLPRWWSSWRRG